MLQNENGSFAEKIVIYLNESIFITEGFLVVM